MVGAPVFGAGIGASITAACCVPLQRVVPIITCALAQSNY